MPSGLPSKDGQSYPITYSFGLVVLLALAVLVALRYFYGAIRVEGGVRLWRLTGRG
jgi:hypothetical protein